MDSWDMEVQAPAGITPGVTTIHIRQELHIEAGRPAVWDILTHRVNDWWSHPHRIQDRDSTMNLELAPLGSLVEHWEDSGFATWGHVSQLDPGVTLEFTGPCGMGAVHGVYTFHLEDREGGVRLTLSHDAFGPMRGNAQHIFEEAWHVMLVRVKELAEGKLAYGADARSI